VHHHRCLPDQLSIEDATELAAQTWQEREQYCHLSSPRGGWEGPNNRAHADYVDAADFPDAWLGRRMTVDVEAKAKERAVVAIMQSLNEAVPLAKTERKSILTSSVPAAIVASVTP
jgi:UV DNA damage endonuclease